jgi:hypothetical protein
MEYRKPELIPMGRASDRIQSILAKGPFEWDHMQAEPVLTNSPAYQADE